MVVCPQNSRKMSVLDALIKKHVHPGYMKFYTFVPTLSKPYAESHIMTDCWGGYNGLVKRGIIHTKVNHSKVCVVCMFIL